MTVSEDELIRMRAKAAEVTARVDQLAAELDEVSTRIKAVSVTAKSADQLIRATVGPEGRLTRLELDRDIYTFHTPDELAREIEETIAAAATEAQQRVMAMCRPFVSDDQMQAALSYDYKTLAQGLTGGTS